MTSTRAGAEVLSIFLNGTKVLCNLQLCNCHCSLLNSRVVVTVNEIQKGPHCSQATFLYLHPVESCESKNQQELFFKPTFRLDINKAKARVSDLNSSPLDQNIVI